MIASRKTVTACTFFAQKEPLSEEKWCPFTKVRSAGTQAVRLIPKHILSLKALCYFIIFLVQSAANQRVYLQAICKVNAVHLNAWRNNFNNFPLEEGKRVCCNFPLWHSPHSRRATRDYDTLVRGIKESMFWAPRKILVWWSLTQHSSLIQQWIMLSINVVPPMFK